MSHDQIDHALLNEVRQMMKTKFSMVLDEYNADARAYIIEIHKAVAHRDLKHIATYAHPLKSSSMALGFAGLGQVAKQMETTAKDSMANDNGFPDDLMACDAMLDQAYEHVCKIITQNKEI